MTECPSKFSLAKWIAQDLTPNEMKSVNRHLSHCAACRESVEAIRTDKEEYEAHLDDHLSRLKERLANMPEQEQQGAVATSFKTRLFPRAFIALAAAAVIVIAFAVVFLASHQDDREVAVSFKGSMTFKVVAKRGTDQFFIKDGTALRENDALRFIVTTSGSGYLFVCSVDSQGGISPFYPETDPLTFKAPLKIETAGRHELPGSIILDDQLGTEYLVVIFSKKPFSRKRVHELLAQKHHLLGTGWVRGRDYPSSLIIDSLMVRKTQ